MCRTFIFISTAACGFVYMCACMAPSAGRIKREERMWINSRDMTNEREVMVSQKHNRNPFYYKLALTAVQSVK